jgi:hypothetical protein
LSEGVAGSSSVSSTSSTTISRSSLAPTSVTDTPTMPLFQLFQLAAALPTTPERAFSAIVGSSTPSPDASGAPPTWPTRGSWPSAAPWNTCKSPRLATVTDRPGRPCSARVRPSYSSPSGSTVPATSMRAAVTRANAARW